MKRAKGITMERGENACCLLAKGLPETLSPGSLSQVWRFSGDPAPSAEVRPWQRRVMLPSFLRLAVLGSHPLDECEHMASTVASKECKPASFSRETGGCYEGDAGRIKVGSRSMIEVRTGSVAWPQAKRTFSLFYNTEFLGSCLPWLALALREYPWESAARGRRVRSMPFRRLIERSIPAHS